MSIAQLMLGDGLTGLIALPPASVHLILTDPPFGATRAAWDRPPVMADFWAAVDHALVDGGILVSFASMRLAVEMIPAARRRFAYDLVWPKNRPSGHLNARKRPRPAHELLLVFGDSARGEARYTPQFTYGHVPMHRAVRRSKSELYGSETVTVTEVGRTDRYATSILHGFPCVANDTKGRIHSSQKPVPLLAWLVRAYSKPGELVVDPYAGSGSTLHAARAEGRRSLGWEIAPAMHRKASRWLAGTDSPLFEAVA